MYICTDCKELFEETKAVTDYVTDDPYPMGPTIYVCPHCGSDDYEEAKECPDCLAYYSKEALVMVETDDGDIYVCPDCYEDNYFVPPDVEED